MELEDKAKRQKKFLNQAQSSVSEVIDQMEANVDALDRREEHLAKSRAQLEELEQSATLLQNNANKLANKFWWQDMKYKILLVIVGFIILILIIVLIIWNTNSES